MRNNILFSTGSLKAFTINFSEVLKKCFQFTCAEAEKRFNHFCNHLSENIYIAFEFPYVDKLYRDSYYNFYASKHIEYKRDCIRISFFNHGISKKDFLNKENHITLKEHFVGFLILRPIPNHIIGRSVISPKALKMNDFISCLVDYTINVHGLPLTCSGFPHASQTTETITCAETSIWSILEYYGYRYKEYSPVLPSEILKRLNTNAIQRLVPSEGLSIFQISQSLKDFGFSPVLYAKNKFKDDFQKLLYTYIESGIPVILGLKNKDIGHAVICIGHKIVDYKIDSKSKPEYVINKRKLYDAASLNTEYVMIDDNYPPYQVTPYNKPGKYYKSPEKKAFDIEYFVVPLYKRMYLEAFRAKKLLISILNDPVLGITAKDFKSDDYVLRFFLTSQRSYKRRIPCNSNMSDEMKTYLLNLRLPKFIWVAEISNKSHFSQKLVESLIILDATGDNSINSLCFLSYPKKRIDKNNKKEYNFVDHSWEPFNIYKNNLKGEWCLWNSN